MFVPRASYCPVPEPGGDEIGWYQAYLAMPEVTRPWMRALTARRFDPRSGWLDVDVVLHGEGPVSQWATSAVPGDRLQLYGPDPGSQRQVRPHDWRLYAGDCTALPAIAASLERLAAGEHAVVLAGVPARDRIGLPSAARAEVRWVLPDQLAAALGQLRFPQGRVFAWLAGEAGAVRTMRRHMLDERGVTPCNVAFAGYWRARLTQDDAPTPQDIQDAVDIQ